MKKILIGIVMGSDSDLPVMSEAAKVLDEFNVLYSITIVSAHRTPEYMYEYATQALENGLKIIIAGAGGAAHLPGMLAALSPLPVIGVPVKSKTMNGLDSLYSIVQMPAGVPVATVAINGATNAGLLAVQILSINDTHLQKKVIQYKQMLKNTVLQKNEKLAKMTYQQYLNEHCKNS